MASADSPQSGNVAVPTDAIREGGTAAADNVEKIYAGQGPAAAAERLRADYLDLLQKPAKDNLNMTELNYEMGKLQTDAGKHDNTLLACATEWGIQLLGSTGGINQTSLERIAATGSDDQFGSASNADPYGQAMAAELDQNWQAIQGMGHQQIDGMAAPLLTLGDLLESRDVDERIRTYKPAPPAPPTLWQRIENFL